jgi:hypothetical protein
MNALEKLILMGLCLGAGGACSKGTDTPTGTVGEAGYGVFHYRCAERTDPVCNAGSALGSTEVDGDLGQAGQIPTAIAVGARFELDYAGEVPESGSSNQPIEIVPARTDVVTTMGGFRFTEPARVAFLARNPQGTTADFIHVTATAPTDIELWVDGARPTAVTLDHPGAEAVAAVVLLDDAGVHLAGALSCTWQSSDETILRVGDLNTLELPDPGVMPTNDEVRMVGMAAGVASLQVQFGDFQAEVAVSVGPEATP